MARLDTDSTIWVALARPDGPPHVTPVWFVWLGGRFWVCTQTGAVKTRLVGHDPRVAVHLDDGTDPVVAEGRVAVHAAPYAEDVRAAFADKYGWDLHVPDAEYGAFDALWEITVDRWLLGGPG